MKPVSVIYSVAELATVLGKDACRKLGITLEQVSVGLRPLGLNPLTIEAVIGDPISESGKVT